MSRPSFPSHLSEISDLLRGDAGRLAACPGAERLGRGLGWVALIVVGSGLFGAAIGWWRSGTQAVYTGLKFPLVILATTVLNTLINALLAPLLGLDLRFRQCFEVVLGTFTTAAAILAAFSPLVVFLVLNVPRLEPGTVIPVEAYRGVQLTEVSLIAFAGIVAHARLARWLTLLSGDRAVARRVLLAWLATNLLLGSQATRIRREFL
jgi:hypothetical protein